MHEYQITKDIIATACAEVKIGMEVEKIVLVVGKNTGFIGESIQMYFDEISKGTSVEGSKLEIIPVEPKLRCKNCGNLFARKIDEKLEIKDAIQNSFKCPKCGGDGMPSEVGKEFFIKELILRK